MGGQNSSLFGKRRRKKYDDLFREWYGSADGVNAAVKHLPQAESLADVLSGITKKLVPPWERKFDLILEHWAELVGEAASKKIQPLKIAENRILLLELRHPAYRMAFDSAPVKKALLEKINALTGEELCREIRFVAPGMYAPVRKKC